MTEGFPLVSVIVATIGRDTLEDCLASVIDQSYPRKEIIVVADIVSPELMNFLKRYSAKREIQPIFNAERAGAWGTRNIGISASRGDIVAFIDDDAVAEQDWLSQIVKGYENDMIGGVCGRILPKSKHPHKLDQFLDEMYYERFRDDPLHLLAGSNMSFRTSVIKEVGMFNSTFHYGPAEMELGLRVLRKGYALKHVADAIVRHDYSRSFRNLLWKTYNESEQSERIGLKLPSAKIGWSTRLRTMASAFKKTRSITVLLGLVLLYIVRRIGSVRGKWVWP